MSPQPPSPDPRFPAPAAPPWLTPDNACTRYGALLGAASVLAGAMDQVQPRPDPTRRSEVDRLLHRERPQPDAVVALIRQWLRDSPRRGWNLDHLVAAFEHMLVIQLTLPPQLTLLQRTQVIQGHGKARNAVR